MNGLPVGLICFQIDVPQESVYLIFFDFLISTLRFFNVKKVSNLILSIKFLHLRYFPDRNETGRLGGTSRKCRVCQGRKWQVCPGHEAGGDILAPARSVGESALFQIPNLEFLFALNGHTVITCYIHSLGIYIYIIFLVSALRIQGKLTNDGGSMTRWMFFGSSPSAQGMGMDVVSKNASFSVYCQGNLKTTGYLYV